jgi:uncharacterized protein (DUF1501 family)
MTLVHALGHARAGDKGSTSNIVVVAYDDAAWRRLRAQLTVARVSEAFAPLGAGPVTRYELPRLQALNFVIENALAGGVARSLAIDPHGKSLSALMLCIDLPDEGDD